MTSMGRVVPKCHPLNLVGDQHFVPILPHFVAHSPTSWLTTPQDVCWPKSRALLQPFFAWNLIATGKTSNDKAAIKWWSVRWLVSRRMIHDRLLLSRYRNLPRWAVSSLAMFVCHVGSCWWRRSLDVSPSHCFWERLSQSMKGKYHDRTDHWTDGWSNHVPFF